MNSSNNRNESCTDHNSEHEKKLQEYVAYLINTHDSLNENLSTLISKLPTDTVVNVMNQLYDYQTKSDEVIKRENLIKQQLKNSSNQNEHDEKKQSNKLELNPNNKLESDIKQLEKDIDILKSKFEEINTNTQKSLQEQSNSNDTKGQSNDLLSSNRRLQRTKRLQQSIVGNLNESIGSKTNNIPMLNYLVLGETNSSDLNPNENASISTEVETQVNIETKQETEDENQALVIDTNATTKISKKVELANNIIRWLKGPLKVMVNGTLRTFDVFAQGTRISDSVLKAVKRRIAEREKSNNKPFKPAYVEITSDWKVEGENADQGFSSTTIWIRDPQGQRLLIKYQELPLGTANEWLAYVLGKQIGLTVNEVQISIYEGNLVTLHTDVTGDDEQTITLLDVPDEKREKIMTDPIIESMDLFDHIIQNVDRNLRNILITLPKTSDINDDDVKLKVHFIDHAPCFGVGKLHFISIVAAKFHTNHLSVVKFDPNAQSDQFEKYLKELPIEDRPLIGDTLNRFAAITNDQFDGWIAEIEDLLTSGQYNRIYTVLCLQRDLAKQYANEWGIDTQS